MHNKIPPCTKKWTSHSIDTAVTTDVEEENLVRKFLLYIPKRKKMETQLC